MDPITKDLLAGSITIKDVPSNHDSYFQLCLHAIHKDWREIENINMRNLTPWQVKKLIELARRNIRSIPENLESTKDKYDDSRLLATVSSFIEVAEDKDFATTTAIIFKDTLRSYF